MCSSVLRKPAITEKEIASHAPCGEETVWSLRNGRKDGYIYRKLNGGSGRMMISPAAKVRREVKSTAKTDARDRRRMKMRQDMISRKMSLRDKARREIKSTAKTDARDRR